MLATYVAYITKTNLFHKEQRYLEVVPMVLTLVKMLSYISCTLPVIYMILYKQQPQEFSYVTFVGLFVILSVDAH